MSEEWKCPACRAKVDALGPVLLQLAIADHIRAHERAAQRRGIATCGERCTQMMTTSKFCAARNFGMEGPTMFDEQFLAAMHVAWDAPVSDEEVKRNER